jgi:hypothetical protein
MMAAAAVMLLAAQGVASSGEAVVVVKGDAWLPLQRDAEVTFQAVDPATSVPVALTGELWVYTPDSDSLEVPRQLQMRDGRATATLFARTMNEVELQIFEPQWRTVSPIRLPVKSEGRLGTTFFFDGFDGQLVVMNGFPLTGNVRFFGEGTMPRGAHVEVRDRRGSLVLARNLSVAELASNAVDYSVRAIKPIARPTPTTQDVKDFVSEFDRTIRLHTPGQLSVEVTFTAQSAPELPQATGHRQEYIGNDPAAQLPEAATQPQPDGVTTTSVMGYLVRLEGLPTTATVVSHDRSSLSSFSITPREALNYNAPFGVKSADMASATDEAAIADATRMLRWHRRLGGFWAIETFHWDRMETAPLIFDWDRMDRVVNAYRAEHLRLITTITHPPAWSKQGEAPTTPGDLLLWRGWVRGMVERYAMKILGYEIWVNPNTTRWSPKPDVKAYRELVKSTAAEVRGVSAGPRVVAGSTEGFDLKFMEALLADGLAQLIDVVSVRLDPQTSGRLLPSQMKLAEQTAALQDILLRSGTKDKEVWLTGLGWSTMPGGVNETEQANWLVRGYTTALMGGVNKTFWSELRDSERLPWEGEASAHSGLLDSAFRPKPAAVAFNLLQFLLLQLAPDQTTTQGRATVNTFQILPQSSKVPGKIHVVWTSQPGEEELISLRPSPPGALAAIDMLGAEVAPENARALSTSAVGDQNRDFQYRIGFSPVFIWDVGNYQAKREPAPNDSFSTAPEEIQ